MARRRFLLCGLVLLLSAASIFVVFSQGTDYDSDLYTVSDDAFVTPLLVPTYPEGPFGGGSASWNYFLRNGLLYFRNGSTVSLVGTDSDYVNLGTVLQAYDIATVADVQAAAVTIPDLVSSYTQYFGPFPFNYSRTRPNSSGLVTPLNNFRDLVTAIAQDLQLDLCTLTNRTYLTDAGVSSNSATSVGLVDINRYGFLGLSANLLGPSGSALFMDYTGNSNSYSSLLRAMSSTNDSFLKSINRYGESSILDSDGSVQTVNNVLNSQILANGFLGLRSIIHGQSASEGSYSFIDFTDLSVEDTVTSDNLFSVVATGIERMQHDFAYYLYSHGTNMDIEMRQNMQEQADAFVDDFTSSSGQGTPSASNISDTAGISGSIKGAFSGSSSPADAFSQIVDSGNYGFLSSQVQQELNPFHSSRAYSVDDDHDDVHNYVQDKLDSILRGVGATW